MCTVEVEAEGSMDVGNSGIGSVGDKIEILENEDCSIS